MRSMMTGRAVNQRVQLYTRHLGRGARPLSVGPRARPANQIDFFFTTAANWFPQSQQRRPSETMRRPRPFRSPKEQKKMDIFYIYICVCVCVCVDSLGISMEKKIWGINTSLPRNGDRTEKLRPTFLTSLFVEMLNVWNSNTCFPLK